MCRHTDISLVQGEMKDHGPFLTVQCDMCGQCLPRVEIDDATLYAWNAGTLKVPTMDYKAYRTATEQAIARLYRDEVARLEAFAAVVEVAK
jgi:hypothetical protein